MLEAGAGPSRYFKPGLKGFRANIDRIHVLRNQRVDTSRVVQALGAPGMLYGIDTIGASNTHLHRVRVAALKAALPPGAARNTDIAFAILDAGGG